METYRVPTHVRFDRSVANRSSGHCHWCSTVRRPVCLFFLLQSFFSQLSAFAWRKARQTLRKLQVEHAKQNVKHQTHQFCGRLSVLLAHDGTDEEAKERMKGKNEVAHLVQIGCSCTFQIGVLQFFSVARTPPYRICIGLSDTIRYSVLRVFSRPKSWRTRMEHVRIASKIFRQWCIGDDKHTLGFAVEIA